MLAVGNFLNAGSFVGDAEGFTADSLLKVRVTSPQKESNHATSSFGSGLRPKTQNRGRSWT